MGGVVSAAARTVVETPFELMKVRLQTGGSGRASGGASLLSSAQLAELYTGAGPTFYRATLMLGSFFVLCDYFERLAPELMAVPPLVGRGLLASWQRRSATAPQRRSAAAPQRRSATAPQRRSAAAPQRCSPALSGGATERWAAPRARERSARDHQISLRSP